MPASNTLPGCRHILDHVAAVLGTVRSPPHAAAAPGHEYHDPRQPVPTVDAENSSDDGYASTEGSSADDGDLTSSPLNVERAFFTTWHLYGDFLQSSVPELGVPQHAEFAMSMSHILPALQQPPSTTLPELMSVEHTQPTFLQELRKDMKNAADANDVEDTFEPAPATDSYPRIPEHLHPSHSQSPVELLEAWARTGICTTHAGEINLEQLLFLTLFAILLQDIPYYVFLFVRNFLPIPNYLSFYALATNPTGARQSKAFTS